MGSRKLPPLWRSLLRQHVLLFALFLRARLKALVGGEGRGKAARNINPNRQQSHSLFLRPPEIKLTNEDDPSSP